MSFGKLPVTAQSPSQLPIIPINKWTKTERGLSKRYLFQSVALRNEFVRQVFLHEEEVNHHGSLLIEEEHVDVSVQTKDINSVTELDKEYARALDHIFKDVVYKSTDDER